MKLRHSLLLLLTATIWGVAFVAQSVGMDYVGPFTFLFARNAIGGLVVLPVVAVLHRAAPLPAPENAEQKRRARRTLLVGGVSCGVVLCVASMFQQTGLLYTTVGKSGFLTACYILIVPLLGLLVGRRCGKLVWCGVALAVVGLYFLCLTDALSVNLGDLLTFFSAILFAGHIMIVDHFAPRTDAVKMSCIQFFVCAVLAGVGMLVFEQPSLSALLAAWQPVLYAGVLSSGVAFTLQIIGQRGLNPTVASLIMSLESVISVLAGWVILHQTLSGREIFGCVLMFAAIVLAQLPEPNIKKAVE